MQIFTIEAVPFVDGSYGDPQTVAVCNTEAKAKELLHIAAEMFKSQSGLDLKTGVLHVNRAEKPFDLFVTPVEMNQLNLPDWME